MNNKNQIQVFQTNNELPSVKDVKTLASVRMDERNNPRYGKVPSGVRRMWLNSELVKLNMIKHIKPDPNMLQIDVVTLDEYIMENDYAKDLTQAEIVHAFRRGLKGDFGEYYGLTADALYGFLEGFLATPEKKEAARLVRIAKGIEKPESEGAVDYLKAVREHTAKVWADRMKQWAEEEKENKQKHNSNGK